MNKIKDYLDIITLIKDDTRLNRFGTQTYLINKHFNNNKCCKKYEWTINCDIDEYIYARNNYKTISEYLHSLNDNVHQIWIPWKIFWSNNHKNKPKCIISNFYKRSNINIYLSNDIGSFNCGVGFGKSITRSKYIKNIDIHRCRNIKEYYDSKGLKLTSDYPDYDIDFELDNLHLNHYMFMSEQYYKEVKSIRAGGEEDKNNIDPKYTMEYFYNENNSNRYSIDDFELAKKKY